MSQYIFASFKLKYGCFLLMNETKRAVFYAEK